MAYSDLIPDDFRELLNDSTASLKKNYNAEVSNLLALKMGSLPMIEDFLSDRIDICILAIPEKNDIPILDDDKLIKIPFGYKSSVVVINKENPVSELTLKQLATIFGEQSSSSNIRSWRDFGMSSFSTSSIKAYAVKEDEGITSDLFRYSVLNASSFNSSVVFDEVDDIERMITQDKAAIGIFPSIPNNPNLKVLFIAEDDQSIAYGPSIDNVFFSDYSIRLPFYIVYNQRDAERLFPLIKTLLGDSVSETLEANDFFPLPKVIREKYIIDSQLYIQENEE